MDLFKIYKLNIMKIRLKNIYLLLFTILAWIVYSCSSDDGEQGEFAGCTYANPTYLLTEEEKEKVISYPYEIAQRFVYKNANNDSIVLTVNEIDKCPKGFYRLSMFFISGSKQPDYTYESHIIRLQIDDTQIDYDNRSMVNYYTNRDREGFYNGFNFPIINKRDLHFAIAGSQYPSNVSLRNDNVEQIGSMNLNGNQFSDVVKYATLSVDTLSNPYDLSNSKKYNTVYYSPDFGIIQMDDVYGNEYKLVTDLNL
jgi:hypothetical protein